MFAEDCLYPILDSCFLCYTLVDHIAAGLFLSSLFFPTDLCFWFYFFRCSHWQRVYFVKIVFNINSDLITDTKDWTILSSLCCASLLFTAFNILSNRKLRATQVWSPTTSVFSPDDSCYHLAFGNLGVDWQVCPRPPLTRAHWQLLWEIRDAGFLSK